MPTFPCRHYTDADNRILSERVILSSAAQPLVIAERERALFAEHPAADSIDAVDAAYRDAGITFPDSLFRDHAIAAHVEEAPSFALRSLNAAAETALSAVYRGEDLAQHVVERAQDRVGNPDRAFDSLLAHHAGRILPGMVPVNAAARRLIDDTLARLEAMADAARPTRILAEAA